MTRPQLKRHIVPVLLCLSLVGLALWFQHSDNPFVTSLRDRMEYIAYDLRLRFTLPANPEPHPNIVIVDIDDKSLGVEGRWPWPREKMALLVDKLYEAGVYIIAFDVFFSEPEENPALSVVERLGIQGSDTAPPGILDSLQQIAPGIDGDGRFAASLQDKEVILGFVNADATLQAGTLGLPLHVSNIEELGNATIASMNGYTGNLPVLTDAARFSGFVRASPDDDGVIRRSNMIVRYGDQIYPSLALEAARLFFAVDKIKIKTAPIGGRDAVESISMEVVDIPTDGDGSVIVPYRGGPFSFTYLSATDILSGNFPREKVESTIAFIGTSAAGLADIRPTPVSRLFPGVEVHANILAGILDQYLPAEPPWAEGANFFITLLYGLILALLLPFAKPLALIVFSVVSAAGLVGFNVWLWTDQQLVMAVATPLLMIFFLVSTNLAYGFFFESKGKRQLKDQFGSYVPPELVEQMMDNPESFGFDGERREMTVLFADIRSFTTISESLSATRLKDMLNRFFTPMTGIIFNKRGTIDKYVGDMIMAFWGAPLRDEDHAAHAIDAALTMLEKVEEMKPEFERLEFPEVNIGVGLNTGFMNVGNMGSEFRRAYTVLGDSVNLASRLEGLTKFYGVKLIVGENTRAGQEGFLFRRLDKVRVKGKHEPVTIFEPVCRIHEAGDDLKAEVARHEQGIDAYLAGNWAEARAIFNELAAAHPDTRVYAMYLERLTDIEDIATGEAWDGVFEHKTK